MTSSQWPSAEGQRGKSWVHRGCVVGKALREEAVFEGGGAFLPKTPGVHAGVGQPSLQSFMDISASQGR